MTPHLTVSRIFVRANHDVLRTVVGVRDETGAFIHTGLSRHRGDTNHRYVTEIEPHQRADHLTHITESSGAVDSLPHSLQSADFGDHALPAQFGTKLYRSVYDVALFSLQAEVEHELWRHAPSGSLFYAGSSRWRRRAWTEPQRRQLEAECERVPHLSPDEWARHFEGIVRQIRQHRACRIVLFTGEAPRTRPLPCDFGVLADHSYEAHIWLRNAAFAELAMSLARKHDVLIMNAGAILCGLGLDQHVPAPFRYVPAVYPLLTAELARILEYSL